MICKLKKMYVRIILGFLKENAVITTTTTTPPQKKVLLQYDYMVVRLPFL